MTLAKTTTGSWLLALALLGCSSGGSQDTQGETAGLGGNGPPITGGTGGLAATGGAATGGAAATGGLTPTGGGLTTGGVATGGEATGGVATGGIATGGGAVMGGTGGDAAGGAGGTAIGGGGTGGAATGGSSTGGSGAGGSTGGTASQGGGGTGGGSAGSTGAQGGTLAGCTPGKLDATATCNTPDALTGAPGAETDCVGELDGRYGSIYATIAGQQYFLQVNEWGSSSPQTMAHGGDYFYQMVVQQADTGTHGTGAPTGFPSIFIGSNSGHTTANSGLPKAIGEITSVPTTWVWNDNGTLADEEANIFNAAYDVWFNQNVSDATRSGPTGGFLMVWLYDPPNAEPIGGAPEFTGVSIEGTSGTWDIWIGLNGSTPCISYVRTERTLELSFDLKHFIDDATTRPGGLEASWALTNVFTGFEIWSGAENVQTTSFCALVQ